MSSLHAKLIEVRDYFSIWSDVLGHLSTYEEKITFCREKIPELLLNQTLILDILRGMTSGAKDKDRSHRMLFKNEWLIHMDPRRRFSVRMYIHAPGDYTVIHDHSSWGVLGNPSGILEIIKYDREDNGLTDGFAQLKETERIRCRPGETDFTLPLDKGIHQVGNPTDQTIVVINIYGTPLRRLFINHFDLENNRVTKAYPPRLTKRILAADAMNTLIKN